jgi:dTDP-4-dehydrorhamnose 3,5-epimerase
LKFTELEIPDVVLIEPEVHGDERGFLFESYHQQKYADGGIDAIFVQDNHSRSKRGILRGLHAQIARPQGKLVRVVQGEVFDVAVDIRRGSPTFGKHVSALLSAENFNQLWIPVGFAHGFCVTSESAEFEYKCTDFYDPASQLIVRWDDPAIGIDWPVTDPLLSERDRSAELLGEVNDMLPLYEG